MDLLHQLLLVMGGPPGDTGHGENGATGIGRHTRPPAQGGQGEIAVRLRYPVGRGTLENLEEKAAPFLAEQRAGQVPQRHEPRVALLVDLVPEPGEGSRAGARCR